MRVRSSFLHEGEWRYNIKSFISCILWIRYTTTLNDYKGGRIEYPWHKYCRPSASFNDEKHFMHENLDLKNHLCYVMEFRCHLWPFCDPSPCPPPFSPPRPPRPPPQSNVIRPGLSITKSPWVYSGEVTTACATIVRNIVWKNAWKILAFSKMDKPNIIEHVHKPLDYTLFDARWIPCSPRFVVLGNYPRGTGALQIYEVSKGSVNLLKNVSKASDMLHNLK